MTERVSRSEAERRPIDHEVIDLDDGPIEFALSGHRLKIVVPERDLGDDKKFAVDCIIIDEHNYKPMISEGFKGLRDGETVILGRQYLQDRFHFSSDVSGEHAVITRSGTQIAIRDLSSQNGTFLLTTQPRHVDVAEMTGSSIGKHDDRNADAYFMNRNSEVFGVFDGVGSKPGSDRASQLAAQTIEAYLGQVGKRVPRAIGRLAVENALLAAHEAIVTETKGENSIETTAVVAKMFETPNGVPYMVVGHAGDSRAYRMRGGELDHMTLDHAHRMPGSKTHGDAMLAQEILSNVTNRAHLSENAAAAFKFRNQIMSTLGSPEQSPIITVKDYDVRSGDRWLLTSDGIHDNLTTEEIESIIDARQENNAIVQALVAAAKERSRDKTHLRAKRDDITAVIASLT